MLLAIIHMLHLTVLANNSLTVSKPNLVLIVIDDIGYGDLGIYGNKAGLVNKELAYFTTKDSLRIHISDKTRYDHIRMDKFIEKAHARSKLNAQSYHIKSPIPQFAIEMKVINFILT